MIEDIERLNSDLRNAAKTLQPKEARYLVDLYYTTQDNRIRANNQIRAAVEDQEPNLMLQWVAGNFDTTEKGCKSALNTYVRHKRVGRWLLSVHGIGPVIAAGLLAHIDIKQAPTVGHIWRFAGLDPTVKWIGAKGAKALVAEVTGKGPLTWDLMRECVARTHFRYEHIRDVSCNEKGNPTRKHFTAALAKRPWNADLKVLCWKAGKSFVMLRGSDNDVYGKLYDQRKEYEWKRNTSGELAEKAVIALKEKSYGKDTDAYAWYSGQHDGADVLFELAKPKPDLNKVPTMPEGEGDPMLPPAQIDARARRWTVKLFLAHVHHVMYEDHYSKPPPRPYVIDHLGHTHMIEAQGWPCE